MKQNIQDLIQKYLFYSNTRLLIFQNKHNMSNHDESRLCDENVDQYFK